MRKLLGGIVLVAGVGGLGWYGSSNNAKTMQAAVTGAAEQASLGTIHPLSTRVSGRDIIVSGIADSANERDQILAAMHDVQGRRVVRDELRVLDSASPFALNAVKNADSYTYSGAIPTEADRSRLASRIGAGAGDLDLMAGAPDANWTGVVVKGLVGLDVLEDGALSVQGQDVLVSGTARTPSEDAAARAALAELPNGYDAKFDITVLDDGTPFRLTMDLAEDGTATASGKIPSDMDPASLSSAFDAGVEADLLQGNLPPELADWSAVTQSGAAALSNLRSGQMQMTETTLSITGVADPDGKAAAEAMIASLPEGFSAFSDITLYDDGAPFSLEMTSDGTQTTASGKFPAEVAAGDIIGGAPTGDIVTAFISDDTGSFAPVATTGVQALGQLENGTLRVVGTDVSLTGTARTPSEAQAAMALFDGLPEGYNLTSDIATIDDGTPPKFDVTYTAIDGASVSGKLPANIETDDIASFLNMPNVAGTPVQGLIGEDTQTGDQLAALSGWLPELETVIYSKSADGVTVAAVSAPGVDSDLVLDGLSEALGGEVGITVAAPSSLPAEGAERVNQSTGRSETFTSGFWLPMFDFTSGADTCDAQAKAALEADSISFVTGSSTLDAQSMRAINAVASILRKCLADTDLNVEIGGHTDSQGGEDLNRELSQSRAEAVRVALISRGVSDADIVSKGYGESEPIADNETEEGRKANRRTTITWFAPIVDAPVVDDENNTVTTDTNTEVGE